MSERLCTSCAMLRTAFFLSLWPNPALDGNGPSSTCNPDCRPALQMWTQLNGIGILCALDCQPDQSLWHADSKRPAHPTLEVSLGATTVWGTRLDPRNFDVLAILSIQSATLGGTLCILIAENA